MDFDKIIALQAAGFSNDDIKKMAAALSGSPAQEEKPAQDEKQAEAPADPVQDEKPAEAAAAPATDPALSALTARLDQLTGIVENMAKVKISPTLDDVKPLGVEDVVVKFFKED